MKMGHIPIALDESTPHASHIAKGEGKVGAARDCKKSETLRKSSLASVVFFALTVNAHPLRAQTIKFEPIDCGRSEIALPFYGKCGRSNYYGGTAYGESAHGEYYDQYAGYAGPSEMWWAVLQRSRHQGGSFVYTEASRERLLMNVAGEVTRTGANFSQTRRIAGANIKTFTMPGWTCFSFMKDAPYKGAGIEYSLFGYGCGRDARWHQEGHMLQILSRINVRKPL